MKLVNPYLTGTQGHKMNSLLRQAMALMLCLVMCGQTSAELYFVHTDQLGTPQAMTDKNKTVVWEAQRGPFGEQISSVTPALNLGFPGQYLDNESGLNYNYFRDYDAGLGRYVESDLIGLRGGINTYAYVRGNPINAVDPLGLAEECKTVLKLPGFDVQECHENGKQPSDQDAKDAKRMSDKQLDKACKNNGYKNAHDMKDDLKLNSKSDIFSDSNGNMYSGPRQGTGTPEWLHMNVDGYVD